MSITKPMAGLTAIVCSIGLMTEIGGASPSF